MPNASVKSWLEGRSRSLRLAALWIITRRDGEVLRFTDHDQDIIFEGETFTPMKGVDASARQRQVDLEHSNLNIIGMLSDDTITDEELAAGLWREAVIEEVIVDWRAPWAGHARRDTFIVAETKRVAGQTWEAKLQGLTRKLETPVGRTYSRNCRHILGDNLCKVDLGPLTKTGIVVAVTDPLRIFEATGAFETEHASEETWFDGGVLEFTTGRNALANGVGRVEVKRVRVSGGDPVFELQLAAPLPIAIGDEFTVVPGCNKTSETCKSKFNNFAQFGGFPFIPGNDKMLQTPRVR